MLEKLAVGVDLGATNVRVAVGDKRRGILAKFSEATERGEGPEGISRQIIRMIHSIRLENFVPEKILGLGIGSIGPLDPRRGAIAGPANLPWEYIPLVEPIQGELGVPVRLLNDCTASVVGEREFGASRGVENLVYVTISTGIGGGVYVDGHLLIGKDGNAHEIGHITIDMEGRLRCGCGKRGHWEAYCSGMNIPNYVRMLLVGKNQKTAEKSLLMKLAGGDRQNITAKGLYDAAKAGDPLSKEFVEKIGQLNAIGFANIINVYDPELITAGGTVTLKNPNSVMEPIYRHLEKYALNRLPEIRITTLGEDVGLYGALAAVYISP
jgi:glucokinase